MYGRFLPAQCLLYSLSLKFYPFHIFYRFSTLNYFPFLIKYFPTYFHTIPIISNIFPINPIISTHFPHQIFPFHIYSHQIIHNKIYYTLSIDLITILTVSNSHLLICYFPVQLYFSAALFLQYLLIFASIMFIINFK